MIKQTFFSSALAAILLVCSAIPLQAQQELESYEAVSWESPSDETFNYRWRAPDKMKKGEKYPLLFFLHGAGGRGDDNKRQLNDAGGVKAFAKQGVSSKRKSYVFAGQVPNGQRWVDVHWNTLEHKMPKASKSMAMALEVLEKFVANKKNQVDRDRIYVMGLSMGGYGTWDAIQRRPQLFAAAVPICGGGDKSLGQKIAKLPIWAWHGDKDGVIKASRSRDMIDAIKAAGGAPKYTEIKGRGHNAWTDVWNSDELWNWLYSQKRK
jgi:predicted peptidase